MHKAKWKSLVRENLRLARMQWSEPLSASRMRHLASLTKQYGFALSLRDLSVIDGAWYVTHAGLLRLALRRRCFGINTSLQRRFSDPSESRWVFKATVFRAAGLRGFTGYGDADPSNVSPLVRGAEMRVAETRAVNRALRKAYGIGLCSVEELKYAAGSFHASERAPRNHTAPARNSPGNGQPRLRDRLCLLIRQHRLDANLVKRYAAAFCEIETLRDARREQVEGFIEHLAEWATRDREGLLCKLNSFAAPEEVAV